MSMIYTTLEKQKLPGISKIKKLPGIDQLLTKKAGTLFITKYFLTTSSGPRMIGMAAKDKSFKNPYGVILYDLKLQPAVTFVIKPTMEDKKLLEFIGKLVSKSKYKVPKRKITKESIEKDSRYFIQELNMPAIDPDTPTWLKVILASAYAMYGIFMALLVILMFWGWIESVWNWFQEKYVSGPLERKINDQLFAGQEKNDSAFSHYADLTNFIEFVLDGNQPAMIICGKPGLSKTYILRRTLHFKGLKPGKDYAIEKGASLGLQSTYDLLYKHKNRILILDDFDTPLHDVEVVNLLKAITDSYGKRIISLPREVIQKDYESGGYSKTPTKFEFKGRVIIITNLVRKQISPALISRAPLFEVEYNTEKIAEMIKDMLKYINPQTPFNIKQEVYEYVMKLYKNDKNIDLTFRSFKGCVDARIGIPTGWKNMVQIILDYKGKSVVENYLRCLSY